MMSKQQPTGLLSIMTTQCIQQLWQPSHTGVGPAMQSQAVAPVQSAWKYSKHIRQHILLLPLSFGAL